MTTNFDPRFVGYWNAEGLDEGALCIAVHVFGDARHESVLADLLYWQRGRDGCSTRTSDVITVPMNVRSPSPHQLELEGEIPLADGTSRPVSLSLASVGDVTGPAVSLPDIPLSIGGVARSVRLTPADDPFPTPTVLPTLRIVD